MRQIPHLQCRPSGYMYRQRIPKELRDIFKQTEITIALRTRKAPVAKQRALPLMSSVNGIFLKLKELIGTISHDEARRIAEQWKRGLLDQDFEARLSGQPSPPIDHKDQIHQRMAEIRQADYRANSNWASSIMNQFGLQLEPDSQDWRRMAFYLWKAEIERLAELERRDRGENPHLMEYYGNVPEPQQATEDLRLSVQLKEWEAATSSVPRTIQQFRNAVRRFVELKGDLSIQQIQDSDIIEFRDAYMCMPRKIAGVDRNLSLPQLVAKYKDQDITRIQPKTVNNALVAISAILGWCQNRKLITKNPASGVKVEMPKINLDERVPFSNQDLKAIFEDSPVFRDGKGFSPSGKDACFWIPVLALYTGARMEELGCLYASDVVTENGITYIDIYADQNKRVKTKSSIRKVPIHRDVLALGFLDYVEKIRRYKYQWLFPHLKSHGGRRTHYFSKWFSRYLRKECGIKDTRKVFHCFRHTFKDAGREAELDTALNHRLTGHTQSSEGDKYGSGFSLAALNRGIQKISFPGLNIPKPK